MVVAKPKKNGSNGRSKDDGGDAFKPPKITRQPSGGTVDEGKRIRIQINATGVPRPRYNWKHNGTPVDGAIGNVLVIPVARKTHAGSYICEVTNCAGSETSRMVTIQVNKAEAEETASLPQVSVSPSELKANPGESFTFTANLASEPKDTTYQWYKDGIPIRGAIGPIFKVMNAKEKYVGSYTVVVSCGDSYNESAPARLLLSTGEDSLPDPTNPSMTMNIEDLGKIEVNTQIESNESNPDAAAPKTQSKTKIIDLNALRDQLPTLTQTNVKKKSESPVQYGNLDDSQAYMAEADEDDELTGGFLSDDLLATDDATIMVVQEDDHEATILFDPGDMDLSVLTSKEPSLNNVLARSRAKSQKATKPVESEDATQCIPAEMSAEAGDHTIILSPETILNELESLKGASPENEIIPEPEFQPPPIENIQNEPPSPESDDAPPPVDMFALVSEDIPTTSTDTFEVTHGALDRSEGTPPEPTNAAEIALPSDQPHELKVDRSAGNPNQEVPANKPKQRKEPIEDQTSSETTLFAIPENVIEIPSKIFKNLEVTKPSHDLVEQDPAKTSLANASPSELVAHSRDARREQLLRKKKALEKLAESAEKTKRIRVA